MSSITAEQCPRERLRRQRIFASPLLDIGVFRAPADSELFGAQAPPGHFTVAFPETAVGIRSALGPAFVTDRNVVTLYEPDDVYDRWLVDPRGDHCTFISPSPELAAEFADRGRLRGARGRVFSRAFELCSAATFHRQRRLVRALPSTELPAGAVEEEALAVLDGVAAASAGTAVTGTRRQSATARRHAERAREYLSCHYAEAPPLARVAAAADCSVYHLSRAFRHRYGTTIHRYRTDLALRDAYDQIDGGDRRLLDIAFDLGFASHSHLTDSFSRRFGVLPSTVRRARAAAVAG
jgi:AraC-like DNA-binding protein